jgi:hypothetical protein
MDFVPETFYQFLSFNTYATSTIRAGPPSHGLTEIEAIRVNLAKHHQQA